MDFDSIIEISQDYYDEYPSGRCEKAIAELEALQSRSCEWCNYMKKDECDIRYCWCPTSPLSSSNQALYPNFYCSEWEAKDDT